MSVLLNRAKCPACGSSRTKSIYKIPYSDLTTWIENAYRTRGAARPEVLREDIYELCQCTQCSMIFQSGIPDDCLSAEIYGKWIVENKVYANKFQPMPINHFDHAIALVRKIIAAVPKRPRELRFFGFRDGLG